MERVILAVILVVVAVGVAAVIRWKTGPGAPTAAQSWTIPPQLHRADFRDPGAPCLVVVFSSTTCRSCAEVWAQVRELDDDGVAVQNVAWQDQPKLHQRYGIDAAPTTVVCDAEGVVRSSFVGAFAPEALVAAVGEVRAATR